MSLSSYDDLLRQVESLKRENGHLRQELQDNSTHLTKLETEASTMKGVLSHLHDAMEEESQLQQQEALDTPCTTCNGETPCNHNVINGETPCNHNVINGETPCNHSTLDGETSCNQNTLHGETLCNDNTHQVETPCNDNVHQGETPCIDNYHSTNQVTNDTHTSTENLDQNSNSSTDGIPPAVELNRNDTRITDSSDRANIPPPTGAKDPKSVATDNQGMKGVGKDAPRLPGGGAKETPTSPDSPKEAPNKKHSGDKQIYSAIQELDKERNSLLQEIENEDKHRKWYYDQLEALEQKIHSLPVTDNYNLQTDMTRRQLEFEIQRIQEVMRENLGSAEEIGERHQARIQRIHMIENEMLQLQQRHRQQLEDEKVVSCSRVTSDTSASLVLDPATADPNKAAATSEVSFVEASYHEVQGNLPDGTLLYGGPNGSKLITIATQTADQLFPVETGGQLQQQGAPSPNQNLASLYHGAWPIDGTGGASEGSLAALANQDTASVMSFHSNNTSSTFSRSAQHHLGTKVEMVYSLLSMLGTHDKDDMSRTLLAMSSSQDSCVAMRQSGCLPLLIQLLHGSDKDSGLLGNTRGSKAARARAAAALHNVVHSHPDDKRGRREARVLRLLEQIRAHCDQLRGSSEDEDEKRSRPGSGSADIDHHPGPAIAALMKLSFDEEHRHAICTLGGLQAIAELLQLDHEVNSNTLEQYNITMRRYACMALTNLTFGDGTNKALLCSMKCSMRALVAQLQSPNEDLRQVAASVLRNLSWRADLASKKTLREVGSVTALMLAAMEVSKESTLKSILSALWNLSAHCSENKADICAVEGSLAFLVTSLMYKSPSKTLSIIENGGGILRNVSSHIAVREDYRKILRNHNCLHILLKHLRSPSLTIVSNACGTLWNLSARCLEDQKALWEMGAVSMLRNLVHSKHKMISMGSAAALKNLLSARPNLGHIEGDRLMPTNRPGLHVRKQRALEAEIDQNLAETCENLESPTGSPTETRKHDPVKHKFVLEGRFGCQSMESDSRKMHMRGGVFQRGGSAENSPLVEHRIHSPQRGVSRSGSQDSVGSTHSDISHDRGRHNNAMKGSRYSQDMLDSKISSSTTKGDISPRSGDRAGSSGSSQNSRITKVMHEVVKHAGMDHSGNSMMKQFSRGDQMSRSSDSSLANMQRSQPNGNADRLNLNYSNRTQCMERLHLNMPGPEQDEPINYSMKYPSEPQTQNGQVQGSAFARPTPKVQNYVGNTANGTHFQRYNNQSQSKSSPTQNELNMDKPSPSVSKSKKQYSEYADTDIGLDDQPTDFSLRFCERDEEPQCVEKPIDYSTRYKEQESGYSEHQHKDNIRQHMHCLDEDTIKTFCTEGTPLTFLSTATSMNDLSAKADKDEGQVPPAKDSAGSPQDLTKTRYAESEKMSATGTHSTDRNTGSTVILNRKVNVCNTPSSGSLPSSKQSPPSTNSSQPPSMYSYNDNTTSASSPSDRPKAYCTEGTPMSFSRRSSLSSLHSNDAHDSGVKNKGDVTMQNANDSGSLDTSLNADVTLKPELHDDSYQSANNSGPGKTVTFDENNQVQETPLMFSRCSSLGSLSSFDSHSVHSSVISEYSRRASEVVSPSELPDSPSDTMPPSPSHRKSPVRFGQEENQTSSKAEKKPEKVEKHKVDPMVKLEPIPECAELPKQTEIVKPQAIFKDDIVAFADEGSPPDGNFSSATSLSALTFDDEPSIKKDPGLRRVPLGQETDPVPQNQAPVMSLYGAKEQSRQSEPEKEASCLNEDEDNSSVSEGEEDLLLECIKIAMPTSSKKKIKKSSSDGGLKQKSAFSKPEHKVPTASSSNIPSSASTGMIGRTSRLPMPSSRPVARLQGIIQKKENLDYSQDSPKKFSTEDTPLNYSRAESLSDLSMDSDDINETMNTVIDARTRNKAPEPVPSQTLPEEDHSDLSSLSDEDEDLLSVAIESAMPKSGKQKWKSQSLDRKAEGSEKKESSLPSTGLRRPHVAIGNNAQRAPRVDTVAHERPPLAHSGDSVQTYAVEGTPINFSRATSLSDLTVADMMDVADGASEPDHSDLQPTDLRTSHKQQEPSLKVPKSASVIVHGDDSSDSHMVFKVEGTPMLFSRNDSLSDLSCDDDDNMQDMLLNQMNLADEVESASQPSSPKRAPPAKDAASPRKSGIQPPAITRLKTPSRSRMCAPSSTSTPLTKKAASPMHGEEHVMTFATEGTPMCFSRNSSLSSLNSSGDRSGHHHDDTIHVQSPPQHQEPQPLRNVHLEDHQHDSSRNYMVEDTPANLSGHSSLSALSVESLSFDPSENAFLEECINAAMPKSKKKPKEATTVRTSPGGSSDVSTKRKSPRTELFEPLEGGNVTQNDVQPKNEQGPQAERIQSTEKSQDKQINETDQEIESQNEDKVEAEGNPDNENKTSSTNVEENTTIFYIPGADGSDPDYEDEKLLEAIHEVENNVAGFNFRTEEPTERSLCLEARKLPVHLLQKMDMSKPSTMTTSQGTRTLEFSSCSSDMDLMKESFPDMSSSLVSNLTTPDHEDPPKDGGSGDTTLSSRANTTVINLLDTVTEGDSHDDSLLDQSSFDDQENDSGMADRAVNISADEERALEENANIILSELSLTRDLTTSIVDDEYFIENETISLVSNDYNSDTASEVSVSMSSSSKTASEVASEASSAATVSNPAQRLGQTRAVSVRPRIVKPGSQEDTARKEQDGPRGIRGGKKLASAAVRGVSAGSPPKPVNMTAPAKVIKGGAQKNKSPPTVAGRGTAVTPPRKTSPGNKSAGAVLAGKQGSNSQLKKTSPGNSPRGNQTSPMSSPKLVRKSSATGLKQSPPSKAGGRGTNIPGSGIPKVGGAKTSPRGANVDAGLDVERPAPPIKQGTFTKDTSPTENAPKISPETSMENTDLNGNRPSERRQIPTLNKSPSGASVRSGSPATKSGSPRSEIPIPGNARAREKSSMGVSLAQKQSPPSDTLNSTPQKSTKKDQVAKASPASIKSNNSRSSLNKTSSGSSLNKTGSNSSLNKSTNNNTRPALKRGDSTRKSDSALPRRGSAGTGHNSRSLTPQGRSPSARSTTPTGRSTPPVRNNINSNRPSTPTRQGSVDSNIDKNVGRMQTTNKKPAVSKIANLWRKDTAKKPEPNGNVVDNNTTEITTNNKPTKGPKSPKIGKKFSKFGKSKKEKKVSPVEETKDVMNSIKRSSTYDKLIPDTLEVAHQAQDATSSADDLSAPSLVSLNSQDDSQKNLWRRTYTIPADDHSSDAASIGAQSVEDEVITRVKSKKDKKHSLSLWKKHSQDDKEKTSETPREQPKKKGFSLWRRESSSKQQKEVTKIPSPSHSMTFKKDCPAVEREDAERSKPEPPRRLEGSSLPVAPIKTSPSGKVSVISPVTSPTGYQTPVNAAIVAPFNYNPNQKSASSQGGSAVSEQSKVTDSTTDNKPSSPSRHLTKTEMLIARRRQSYLNSLSSLNKDGDSTDDGSETKRSQCLVTMV